MGTDWQPGPGQTLLVPSGPAGQHLFVLILGPAAVPDRGSAPHVAMVSFTTLRSGVPHDAACVVQAGEHPFIRHASYAYYRDVRIEPVPHVAAMVQRAAWQPHTPCSPELLARLRQGVCASRLASREVKRLFDCP
ncbi:MAG: hypothetical protein QM586_06785 [Xenophilus sp.]